MAMNGWKPLHREILNYPEILLPNNSAKKLDWLLSLKNSCSSLKWAN
jgi:hypothetical protein